MSIEEQVCSECGESDWKELEGMEKSYPERRRERDRTVRRLFRCRSCGAQARRFEDGQSSEIQYSGAMR